MNIGKESENALEGEIQVKVAVRWKVRESEVFGKFKVITVVRALGSNQDERSSSYYRRRGVTHL